jgi:hypothetical protein
MLYKILAKLNLIQARLSKSQNLLFVILSLHLQDF